MKLGKDKLIPFLAITILILGISSTLYVNASVTDKNTISINDHDYTIEQLFSMGTTITISTDDGDKTGVALDEILGKIVLKCPSCSVYTFKGKDGYQQTANWDNVKNGVLTSEKRVFFSNTAHALWVRDIVEIEVK